MYKFFCMAALLMIFLRESQGQTEMTTAMEVIDSSQGDDQTKISLPELVSTRQTQQIVTNFTNDFSNITSNFGKKFTIKKYPFLKNINTSSFEKTEIPKIKPYHCMGCKIDPSDCKKNREVIRCKNRDGCETLLLYAAEPQSEDLENGPKSTILVRRGCLGSYNCQELIEFREQYLTDFSANVSCKKLTCTKEKCNREFWTVYQAKMELNLITNYSTSSSSTALNEGTKISSRKPVFEMVSSAKKTTLEYILKLLLPIFLLL